MNQTGTANYPTSSPEESHDLIVVGAGVGGLTAALVGTIAGLRTLVVEKSNQIGGTSARSSGTVWIPDNAYQREAGITDDAVESRRYLDALVGARADPALREAFLAAGPEMLRFLEEQTDLRFAPYPHAPDYRQELPGAASGWRPLEPLPFDGRSLGPLFDHIASPIPELMLFGGMMVTRGEIVRLLKIGRNLDSFLLGARLVMRYLADRVRHRRGTRLVLGNALVARLYRNLIERGGTVWRGIEPQGLIVEGGRVTGLKVRRDGHEVTLHATKGVVVAGGGFPADPEWRARYLPSPTAKYTAAAEGSTGETIRMAQQAGGVLGTLGEDNALWFPSSVATRADGSTAVYPHIVLDRAKPGFIAVNAAGRRFVNEAVSYHEFTRGMYRAHRKTPCIPALAVCDRRFVWKYGLGMIHPLTMRLGPFVDRGYLFMADTIPELARKIGVDPDGLSETVRAHNEYAHSGEDPDFGKGGNLYERSNGDAEHMPNPCLGPIDRPPYCAVALHPTPLGTSLGLRTNTHAQVLNEGGQPIPGLYACGNDMHSPFGGEYPGAGSQLGLAMTFAYLAATHATTHAAEKG